MKKRILLAIFLLLPCLTFAQLKRVSPESQGIESKHLLAYYEAMMNLKTGETHHIVILRHGNIIGELSPQPFTKEGQHNVYSASKTFVSVAVGLAIEDGLLNLDDKVIRFFPKSLPDTLSENLKVLTIRHLLTMTSGIHPNWSMRNNHSDWGACYLREKVETPGKVFQYDSMVTYLLSSIVQHVTGKKVFDYLNERIFTPLEIYDAEWEVSPEGINTGGWGLRLSPLSMAKFGQLLLNQGKWKGKQLLSAQWVKEMSANQQSTGKLEGYGYHVSLCDFPNVYRADGAFGQYIIVAPDQDMVIAINQANLSNGIHERHLIWEHLLKHVNDRPLKEGKAYQKLQAAEKTYRLPTEKSRVTTPKNSPLLKQPILLGKNPLAWKSLQIIPEDEQLHVHITTQTNETFVVDAGLEHWNTVESTVYPPYTIKAMGRFNGIKKNFTIAGCYGWEEENRLNIHLLFTNWISGVRLSFTTDGDKIQLWIKENTKKEKVKVEVWQ